MNILETQGLYFDYHGLEVLFDVNFQIEKGERHALIGPNGAGKTTLFNVIIGPLVPSKGRVQFKEHDITKARPHELFRLGMGRSFQITSTFFETNRLPEYPGSRPFKEKNPIRHVARC